MSDPAPAPTEGAKPKKPGILEGFKSWRLAAVSLLSNVSGMPLGLVYMAMPAWLAVEKVDIKTIGVLTLAQAPWGFKFLWSPMMDRYALPFLGRKRGWMFATHVALALGIFALGLNAANFEIGVVAALSFLIAFAGASFDIAYDGYAVEVLTKEEHGWAVGARTALYRLGMLLAGNTLISLGPLWGWDKAMYGLAALFVLLLPVTLRAPEPAAVPVGAKTLGEAVWEPFVGFLSRPRALEILAFVTLYRLADSLGSALTSSFLIKVGYDPVAVGIPRGIVVALATIVGTLSGGLLAKRSGVSRALWICGGLAAISNVGYIVLAESPPNNLLMYGALGIEAWTNGMGWGAFGVFMLRLTDKRFSATQYALFSSLVGLTRTLMGPVAGVLVDALGWRDYFAITIFAAIPGLVLLRRFAPWGEDSKDLSADTAQSLPRGAPWPGSTLALFGAGSAAAIAALGLATTALLAAIKAWREHKGFDVLTALRDVALPHTPSGAIDLISSILLGLLGGLAVAAYLAARGRRNLSTV